MDKEVMLGVPDDEGIELWEHRAMIYIPKNAVEVTINATVYEDGELMKVSKKLSMEDIRESFRKADDGYIDENDLFHITEKGIEWLDNKNQ